MGDRPEDRSKAQIGVLGFIYRGRMACTSSLSKLSVLAVNIRLAHLRLR